MGPSKLRPGIECKCLKSNGYCTYCDNICKPWSLKCKNNPKSHKNPFYTGGNSSGSTSKSKLKGGGYDPFIDELYSYDGITKVVDMCNSMPLVLIYSGFLCFDRSKIVDCRLIVTDTTTGVPTNILVAYNPELDKYYMSERQLNDTPFLEGRSTIWDIYGQIWRKLTYRRLRQRWPEPRQNFLI